LDHMGAKRPAPFGASIPRRADEEKSHKMIVIYV